MRKTIEEIVAIEWGMFGKVENVSGRAACQDDEQTFRIMRGSQFEAWDEKTLESYLRDLKAAQAEGRNPLAEKYGYMMESTAPREFGRIRNILPEVPAEKKKLVEELTRQQVSWHEQTAREYPCLASQGRPVHAAEEGPYDASVETYLKGELSTYSMDTLRSYASHMQNLAAKRKNLSQIVLENTARAYGYASLEEAEAGLKGKQG